MRTRFWFQLSVTESWGVLLINPASVTLNRFDSERMIQITIRNNDPFQGATPCWAQ